MTDALNKRNITALHENSKILVAQIGDLRNEVSRAKAQIAQLSYDVLQLRQQVLLSATKVGGGPTVGTNN